MWLEVYIGVKLVEIEGRVTIIELFFLFFRNLGKLWKGYWVFIDVD